MANTPSTVRYTRLLILLNALLWLAFGLVTAVGAHPSYPEPGTLRWAMAISALLAAAFLGTIVGPAARRNRIAYWAVVFVLAAISVAAIFDQFGVADLAFEIITLLPLALLIRDRNWYLQPTRVRSDGNRAA